MRPQSTVSNSHELQFSMFVLPSVRLVPTGLVLFYVCLSGRPRAFLDLNKCIVTLDPVIEININTRGLGARIFKFYTHSVLHKKDPIYLRSVQTLRKQFARFAQTCDLHNMHNMHKTCAQHVRRYLIISENMTHVSDVSETSSFVSRFGP